LCLNIILLNCRDKSFLRCLVWGVLPAVVSKRGVNGGNHYVGALSSRHERAILIVIELLDLSSLKNPPL
jgi:hypothetical protein